jgi:hypothetical protein
MEWTRSETLALASARCHACEGLGLKQGRGKQIVPCKCVFRSIFRACYAKFKDCVERSHAISRPSQEVWGTGVNRRATWGRKTEEFVADFCLVAQRNLTPAEHQIFRFHYLLAADWRLCAARLQLTRGEFFGRTYRIEEKLGQVFRELKPYSLFPLDEYFGGVTGLTAIGVKVLEMRERQALKPPMKRSARSVRRMPLSEVVSDAAMTADKRRKLA